MTILNILLRLLLSHFLADFLLQRDSWVKGQEHHKWQAAGMHYHIAVVAVLTFFFQWDLAKWYVAVIVIFSHLVIDLWKAYRPNTTIYFLLDQLFHILIILIAWLIFYVDCSAMLPVFDKLSNSPDLWVLVLSYYLVIGPFGIAIGKATAKWQKEAGMDTGGLNKAGMWIGRCERVLVLTFIILGQYTALGFLMTAKSILRFGDAEERQQKKTEYILVGTLLSFASAAIIGALVNLVLVK